MRVNVFAAGVVLALAGRAFAQVPVPVTCESVYLPEFAPPEGVQTAEISHTFRVGPGSERPDENGNPYPIFYPFDLSSIVEADGSWTVHVTQKVGHPLMSWRRWRRVQSVSLVSIMAYVLPVYRHPYGWYYRDAGGQWVEGGFNGGGNGSFLLYQTMPHSAPAGVVPSWAYRYDDRTWEPSTGRALSDRLVKGAGWNVGIFAPTGVETVGLQVKALICGERS